MATGLTGCCVRWEGICTTNLLWTLLGTVCGGSGLVGLLFFFLRQYIDKRIQAAEKEEAKRKETRKKRLKIDDELQHAYGRMFFWLYRAITTGQHNGELEAAFQRLQEAEQKKKDLDREILADCEQD